MNDTLPPLDSDLIYRAFHEANRKREHWQGELCSTSFYAGARWAYAIATRPAVLDEWTRNVLAESLRAIERPECAGLAMNTDGLKENLRRLAAAPTPPAPEAQRMERLTDEQIRREKPVCADWVSFRAGVRCAERIHGVGK